MPGAQPKRDWWAVVASQLARQATGRSANGSAKV